MSVNTRVSSSALSTLALSSKEVVISLQAGQPVTLDLQQTFGTSAGYSDRGVAVALELQTFSETEASGVSVVKAICERSGNAAFLPLAYQYFENSAHGSPSSGSHRIVASVSRSPENVVLCYDPVSFARSTTRLYGARLVFFRTALTMDDVFTGGTLEAGLATLVSPSDVVVLRTGDDQVAVGVTSDSPAWRNTIKPSKQLVLSQTSPTVGLGFTPIVGITQTYGVTASRITTLDRVSAETRVSGSDWNAPRYRYVSSSPTFTSLDNELVEMASVHFSADFATLAAVVVGSGLRSTRPIEVIASPSVVPDSCSLVFNARLVYGEMAADGGIRTG